MPARNATPGPSTLPQQPDSVPPPTSKKRGVSDHLADEGPRSKKYRKDLEVAGVGVDDKSAAVKLNSPKENKKRRRKKKKKAPLTFAEIDQEPLTLHTGSRAPASSSLASSTTLSQASVSPPIITAPQTIVKSHFDFESSSAVADGSEKPSFNFIDKGKGRATSEEPDSMVSRPVVGSPQEFDTMKAAQAKIAELAAQLESQKNKLSRYEDNLSHLQQSLTCEICLDLLYKPYALNPCGHVVCYMCLIRWFTNVQGGAHANIEPPATPEDVPRLLTSQAAHHGVFLRNRKSCPLCRAAMVERPVEVWSVKSMVANLVKSKLIDLPSSPPPSATETPNTRPRINIHNDPWRNIFHKPRIRGLHDPVRPAMQFYPPPPDHNEGGEEWGMQDMGMYDAEDGGIYRCLDCMHEIWGGLCTNCQREYAGHARFDQDDEDDDDDDGEGPVNVLERRLRQIRAHNGDWNVEIEGYDDDDDDDGGGDFFDWEPDYWGEVGLSEDEGSLSGADLDEGESSEGEWSSDEADHERALFHAIHEARGEEGIAHIEPVEEGEDRDREPYHSDSTSGTDSDVHERANSDDEEGYQDSFIDDDEEGGANEYNHPRTRRHRSRNNASDVIDPGDSEDESDTGSVLDLEDPVEESVDTREMARRLGRGMRLGGGGGGVVDYDSDMDPPLHERRESSVTTDNDDEDHVDSLGRGDYGLDDEEEEEVQPRRYRTGLRRYRQHLADEDDSDY